MEKPDVTLQLSAFTRLLEDKCSTAKAMMEQKLNKVILLIPYSNGYSEADSPYYDYRGFRDSCRETFEYLNMPYEWLKISMANLHRDLKQIEVFNPTSTVFINLCDGDEINGFPGRSVLLKLSECRAHFTGARLAFYDVSTSKILMKTLFFKANVPTAAWYKIEKDDYSAVEMDFLALSPYIVKPDISFGSYGIEKSSVVHNFTELNDRIKAFKYATEGLNSQNIHIFIEEFIVGPEFTVFVTGSQRQGYIVWPPLERVFHNSLANEDKFVTYERAAHMFIKEAILENNAPYYNYELAKPLHSDKLKHLAESACIAVEANGYCRVDIRQNKDSGKYYVLEVNANCGLSAESDNALGVLLHALSLSFSDLMAILIHNAIH